MKLLTSILLLCGVCSARHRFHSEAGHYQLEKRQSLNYPENTFDQIVRLDSRLLDWDQKD